MKKHIGSAWLAVCGVVASVIQFWPDAMMHAWMFLPQELKDAIPPLGVKIVTYSILMTSVLGKLYTSRREKKKLRKKLDVRDSDTNS